MYIFAIIIPIFLVSDTFTIEENVQFTLADDQESDQLVENKGQLPQTKEPTISTWNK